MQKGDKNQQKDTTIWLHLRMEKGQFGTSGLPLNPHSCHRQLCWFPKTTLQVTMVRVLKKYRVAMWSMTTKQFHMYRTTQEMYNNVNIQRGCRLSSITEVMSKKAIASTFNSSLANLASIYYAWTCFVPVKVVSELKRTSPQILLSFYFKKNLGLDWRAYWGY